MLPEIESQMLQIGMIMICECVCKLFKAFISQIRTSFNLRVINEFYTAESSETDIASLLKIY